MDIKCRLAFGGCFSGVFLREAFLRPRREARIFRQGRWRQVASAEGAQVQRYCLVDFFIGHHNFVTGAGYLLKGPALPPRWLRLCSAHPNTRALSVQSSLYTSIYYD